MLYFIYKLSLIINKV